MNILLLNDNPVIEKFVLLSAQKNGYSVELIKKIDQIKHEAVDILIIDESFYSASLFHQLSEIVRFKYSLYIVSREKEIPPYFDEVIKKPFLPTDIVEFLKRVECNLHPMDIESSSNIEETFIPSVLDEDEVKEVQQLLRDTEVLISNEENAFVEPQKNYQNIDIDSLESEIRSMIKDFGDDFSTLNDELATDYLSETELIKQLEALNGLDEDELERILAQTETNSGFQESKANSTNIQNTEAIHELLRLLSKEEIVKALKQLNISININFGNEK